METETNINPDVARMLEAHGMSAPPPWKRWIKWAALAALVLIVLYFFFGRHSGATTHYVTQNVARGDLTVTVTATGNLEPRNQVDIGVELSGTVREVNVDVNDVVTKGQLLARLDTTRLNAQVLQARSSLASAKARVIQADAGEKEANANYQRLLKVRELSNNKLPSQQDLDVAEAAVAQAKGESAAARAAVDQAQASLETVLTDLSKAEIRSPINGVVLVRSIEPGQTVASSLQAPVLFTLAEDLKKMELHVSVDEADVGSVETGQKATFTVDAFPNRRFNAHITQVHFASSNTKSSSSSSSSSAGSATSTGVVTYETVLEVDNEDLLLRPGMTATAEIVTTSIQDALLIPNAALRFTPPGEGMPGAQQSQGNALSAIMPRMPRRPNANQQQGNTARRMGRAWILENGKPALVMFRPGATDGRFTQVLPLQQGPEFEERLKNMPPEVAERMKQAMGRTLEDGTPVIVDAEVPKKS
ncbi:MAG TPA: efflux RND transporter periplasmic adaptor subunit [Povalibacter sp.]|jgi:HlyD family secretion protein|nr:efflux RND transporter periplasmic adaptor subunit [Povalibacter sp.]